LLDALEQYSGSRGYSTSEVRGDYKNFDKTVYVPAGFTGKTPNGETIDSKSTFLSLRLALYQDDPMYHDVRKQLDAGKAPKINVHRFWGQCEIAITFAIAALLDP
jgi:hypothetical protein